MNSRWNTRTARPNRSWSCVRSDAVEPLALELGRREQGHPDPAGVGLPEVGDLERVAVDEPDRGLARHDDVALVHVADDVAVAVDRVERGGEVAGHPHQEGPRRVGERGLAGGGAVERVDLTMARPRAASGSPPRPPCESRGRAPAARPRTT